MDNKGADKGRGILFILSAPSGSGKSTIAKWAVETIPCLRQSVSCTTRPMRPGEENGKHYNFISQEEFRKNLAAGKFIEWAEVHGNFYGTSSATVEESRMAGRDLLLVIDVQGAIKLREKRVDSVYIFMLPPSIDELKRRLSGRGTESGEKMAGRIATARDEIGERSHYDYLIINDNLEMAKRELEFIVRAERCRMSRRRLDIIKFFESSSRPPERE